MEEIEGKPRQLRVSQDSLERGSEKRLMWEAILPAVALRATADVLIYSIGTFSSFLVLPFINPKISILRK